MRRRTQRSATPPEVPPARAGVRTLTSGAWPRRWGTGRGGRALEVHLPSLTARSPRAEAAVPADLGRAAPGASATLRLGPRSPPRGGQRVPEPRARQVSAGAAVLPLRPRSLGMPPQALVRTDVTRSGNALKASSPPPRNLRPLNSPQLGY